MPKTGYVKARSTMTPWREQEITEREAKVWKDLGILYEGDATTDDGAQKAVENAQAKAAQKVED
jgi:hypothetical protein